MSLHYRFDRSHLREIKSVPSALAGQKQLK